MINIPPGSDATVSKGYLKEMSQTHKPAVKIMTRSDSHQPRPTPDMKYRAFIQISNILSELFTQEIIFHVKCNIWSCYKQMLTKWQIISKSIKHSPHFLSLWKWKTVWKHFEHFYKDPKLLDLGSTFGLRRQGGKQILEKHKGNIWRESLYSLPLAKKG